MNKNELKSKVKAVLEEEVSRARKNGLLKEKAYPVNYIIDTVFSATGTNNPFEEWDTGFGAEVKKTELNFLFNVITDILKDIQQQGLLKWNTDVTYGLHSFVTNGADIFRSTKADNKGNTPVDPDPSGNWAIFKGGGGVAVTSVNAGTGIEVDHTTGNVTVSVDDGVIASKEFVNTGFIAKPAEIVADTKTKITYDKNGLVKSGADAVVADIVGLQDTLDLKASSPIVTTEYNVPQLDAVGNITDGLPIEKDGSASLVTTNPATNKINSKYIPHIPISETRTYKFDKGTDDTAIWTYIQDNWMEGQPDAPALGATVFVLIATDDPATKYILHEIWTFVQHSTPEATDDWKLKENWVEKVLAEEVISVNGEKGVVVLNTDNIDEGATNKYYTEEKVSANVTVVANKALSEGNATKLATVEPEVATLVGNFHITND